MTHGSIIHLLVGLASAATGLLLYAAHKLDHPLHRVTIRSMDVRIERIYDEPCPGDGTRVLVDRIWPRGVSKEDAALDDWMKEIAPSDELRE